MQYILFGSLLPPDPNVTTYATPYAASSSQSVPVNTITYTGNVWRHFSWQIPTMLLGNSIVFTLVAIAIAVFDNARKAIVWQTPEMVTAVCVAVSLAFSVSCYFISWFCIEWKMQEAIRKYLKE
jgi:cation transport ATPase